MAGLLTNISDGVKGLWAKLVRPADLVKSIDGMALPTVLTFPALLNIWSASYQFERSDEAMRKDRRKAMAMYRDGWTQALLEERYTAVQSLPWGIVPEDANDPIQQAVSQGLEKVLRSTHQLNHAVRSLQRALWYGKYGLQIQWKEKVMSVPVCEFRPRGVPMRTEKARVLAIERHMPVNGDKISFAWDGTPLVRINSVEAERLPKANVIMTSSGPAIKMSGSYRERLIVHKHDPEDADWWDFDAAGRIHGVGLRDRSFWISSMRLDFISWVMDVMEKIGAGIPMIRYPMGSVGAKEDAQEIARTLNRRSVIIVPVSQNSREVGGSAEYLEAPANGVAILQALIVWVEMQIERLFVGQSMSSGADNESGLGGSGRADFARDTKAQKISADADELQETITGCDHSPGIVSTMKKYMYPWADFNVKFQFKLQHQDPGEAIVNAQGLTGMGITLKADEVREKGGFSKPTEDDEMVGGMMPTADPSGQVPDELTDADLNSLFEGADQDEDGELNEKELATAVGG